MKTIRLLCLGLLAAVSVLSASAQELRYEDALKFRMINKGFSNDVTPTPYDRYPAVLKDSVPSGLWKTALNSAGLAIRFSTDSRTIAARYVLTGGGSMNHMTDTGKKGLDLYALESDGWHFVNSYKPAPGKEQDGVIVKNMDGSRRDYMLYLPLYDGVASLEIGVDAESSLTAPVADSPRGDKGRIVMYGSSIMQGGCACRPGMCSTNMIQRALDVECVNIGNSGQAKMYTPMANMLASMDNVLAYVLDPVPNCTPEQCDTLTYNFVKTVIESHPGVPVLMVEGPFYPKGNYDLEHGEMLRARNLMFRKRYLELKKEYPHSVFWVPSEGLQALDDEGTVDSCHLTDYGFRAYADVLIPYIRKAVGRKALK